jgi:hypothetical protein
MKLPLPVRVHAPVMNKPMGPLLFLAIWLTVGAICRYHRNRRARMVPYEAKRNRRPERWRAAARSELAGAEAEGSVRFCRSFGDLANDAVLDCRFVFFERLTEIGRVDPFETLLLGQHARVHPARHQMPINSGNEAYPLWRDVEAWLEIYH